MSSMETRWWLLASAAPVAWGSAYAVVGEALPQVAPLWGAAWRALPAGLLLLALRPAGLPRAWWLRTLTLGLLTNAGFFVLVWVSAHRLPSGVAATVTGVSPLAMLVWAALLLGRRDGVRAWGLAVTGLVGVLALVGAAVEPVDAWGLAAALLATVCFAAGTVLARRWADDPRPRPGAITLVAWQLVLSGALAVPAAALVHGPPPRVDGTEALALAYVGLAATALAFVCWFAAAARLEPVALGLVGLLNPVTGVVLGLALGESFTSLQAAGLVLTLLAVGLGARRPPSARQPGQPPGEDAPQHLGVTVREQGEQAPLVLQVGDERLVDEVPARVGQGDHPPAAVVLCRAAAHETA